MAIDMNRIILAAAEAALEGQDSGKRRQPGQQRKGKVLTAPRALLLGAGAYTAGRLLVRARSGGLVDGLQQRLAEYESRLLPDEEEGSAEQDFIDDEEFDDDEDEPEDDYDEDEGPQGEYDDDEEPEDYDEEDDDAPEDELDDEPRGERRRRASSAGSRNGRD